MSSIYNEEFVTSLIEYAIENGLPCFPCFQNKKPACPNGYKDVQIEPEKVRKLWQQYPGPLIGVPTGELSGFDALDIDFRNGGDVWLKANMLRPPVTRIHQTRSGGLHLLFEHQEGLRNSASIVAPGIDVRGDGGYIIWWPQAGFAVENENELAKWPKFLLPVLFPTRPSWTPSVSNSRRIQENKLRGLYNKVAAACEGSRNQILNWAAYRGARDGIEIGLLSAAIIDAAVSAGLPKGEAEKTIASAIKAGLRP